MSIFCLMYISIGLGFYCGIAIIRREAFKNQNFISILRGLIIGIFFWPIATILLSYIKEGEIDL